MIFKFGNLSEWHSFVGAAAFTIKEGSQRRVSLDVVSEGASVFHQLPDGRRTLLASGFGLMEVRFGWSEPCNIVVEGSSSEMHSSVRFDERILPDVGWVRGPSFTDLSPRDQDTIPPEVRRMIDAMNRNALARETALREEFERRLRDK